MLDRGRGHRARSRTQSRGKTSFSEAGTKDRNISNTLRAVGLDYYLVVDADGTLWNRYGRIVGNIYYRTCTFFQVVPVGLVVFL